MVAVPVVAPIVKVVAAPRTLPVVTVAFSRLKVVAVEVRSPPLIAMSPVNVAGGVTLNAVAPVSATVALAIVAVPVAAPRFNVVAAPNALTVVAVVLKTVAVVSVLTMVEASVRMPAMLARPPTHSALATPRPPSV